MLRRCVSTTTTSGLAAAAAAVRCPHRHFVAVYKRKLDVALTRLSFDEHMDDLLSRGGVDPELLSRNFRAAYWRLDEYARRADYVLRRQGFFALPTLDFPWYRGCLPLLSSYQLRKHYLHHHLAHVEALNELVEGTALYGRPLDELICASHNDTQLTALHRHAAQHYNLSFYWKCLEPHGSNIPPDLQAAVCAQYGSVEELQQRFVNAALSLFGSGWVYWVYNTRDNVFDIVSLSNAGCPLVERDWVPLLCVCVWEHAYYIDYENNRAQFLSRYFDAIDWHWAERHWKRATGQEYNEMVYQ